MPARHQQTQERKLHAVLLAAPGHLNNNKPRSKGTVMRTYTTQCHTCACSYSKLCVMR